MIETLSGELASVVEANAASVVRVEGRPRGASSGVVWSAEGVVVASHHAVDAEDAVAVGLADGRTLEAKLVGRDPGRDLVVLRAEAKGLVSPRWAEAASPRVGHLVVGLSRPGRAVRAQLGIVSVTAGPWRTPSGCRLETYLETDLAPHPGFSGSLLVRADGAALGVNTAGLLRGTSLAVPAETVRRVVESVLARGRSAAATSASAPSPSRSPPTCASGSASRPLSSSCRSSRTPRPRGRGCSWATCS